MSVDRNSYSNIAKSISLFGGVKVLQIVVSIVRSKVLAVLIGANGMGIYSLFMSITDMVSTISSCGLQTSAVRDVSKSYSNGDKEKINKTVSVLRKLVLLTGFIGTLFVFFFSSLLSNLTFGNSDYSLSIKIISIILLFNQINVGQTVLIQSTFRYKDLAKSALYSNIIVLIISIPIYYFLRENGIVLSIVVASIITLLFSWYYSKKISFIKVHISLKELWINGRGMLIVGFVLALSGLFSRLAGFVMTIFLSRFDSIDSVGLYSAGYNLVNSYVFIVLSAMATDYVPRLSIASNDHTQLTELVNKQTILLLTLLTPLIIMMSVFIKQVVLILYSNDFIQISDFVEYSMFGMFFRAISWSLSYVYVAKGGSKLFLFNELFICILSLLLKIVGYYFYGLNGLGIAFIITYLWYSVQLYYFLHKSINFCFSRELIKVFFPQVLLCIICVFITKMEVIGYYRYVIGVLLLFISLFNSYRVLDERIGIRNKIQQFLKK